MESSSDDIVISGISGRFPQSDNVQEFKDNLYNGINMVTYDQSRCPSGSYGLPKYMGKIKDLAKFDAEFFNIPEDRAHFMDPQLRILLEVTFEAIVDAGWNPDDLRGSRTGFFYSSCFHETDMALSEDILNLPRYKNIYTTQVPYFFGLVGPIGHFDTACAASFCALNEAYQSIKTGRCDRALVAGFNICLFSMITFQFKDLKMISSEGISRCMDAAADGFSRAEAVVTIFLERASKAKRVYASILTSKSNTDGYKDQGINFPSVNLQRRLMKEAYQCIDVDPNQLTYIEAHTTGTQAGDPVELKAIQDVFCSNRPAERPLLIGCLKSNMGHAEAASGLSALVKAILILQSRLIPRNLNYSRPNPNIEGLIQGSLKPVLENTRFDGDVIPLNCFGFGGSNVHVVIKASPACPTGSLGLDKIPRLVLINGRNEESAEYIMNSIETNPDYQRNDIFKLLGNLSAYRKFPARGYVIISKGLDRGLRFTRNLATSPPHSGYQNVAYYFSDAVPIDETVFADLGRIDIFQSTVDRLHDYCTKRFTIDLRSILQSSGSKDYLTLSMSTIVLHIGLINIMKSLGIESRCYIGKNLGEISCRYARGDLSEHESIACAYVFGTKRSPSSKMAATNGHGPKKAAKVGYNRPDSMKSSNGKNKNRDLNSNLNEIPDSIRKSVRNSLRNCLNSLNQDPTESSFENLPKNITLIQMLNSGSKFHSNVSQVTLINSTCPVLSLLKGLGTLYTLGIDMKLASLYGDDVQYPLGVDTPSLSPLIRWDHSKDFKVLKYPDYFNFAKVDENFNFRCNLAASEDWYLSGHKIDGRVLFPATGYLMLAWAAYSSYHQIKPYKTRIKFEDVKLYRATVLSETDTKFVVNYCSAQGRFTVVESNTIIATGKITQVTDSTKIWPEDGHLIPDVDDDDSLWLEKDDIYKELRVRGYDYGPSFQNLMEAHSKGIRGKVAWKNVVTHLVESSTVERIYRDTWQFLRSWVCFADSALQLVILSNQFGRDLFVPTKIDSLVCDGPKMMAAMGTGFQDLTHKSSDSGQLPPPAEPIFDVTFDPVTRTLLSQGFMVRNLGVTHTSRKPNSPLIESYKFLPLNDEHATSPERRTLIAEYARACSQWVQAIRCSQAAKNGLKSFDEENGDDERFGLGQYLKSMARSRGKKVELEPKSCRNDVLIGHGDEFYLDSYFLKPLIENGTSNSIYCGKVSTQLSLGEFNQTECQLTSQVISILDVLSVGGVHVKYALAHPGDLKIPKETYGAHFISTLWNSRETLPKEWKNLDLLILKPHPEAPGDIQTLFKSSRAAVRTGGCVLFFGKSPPRIDLSPLNGRLASSGIDSDKVEQIALEEGLVLISRKFVDKQYSPFYGLLFRLKEESESDLTFIEVNNNDFTWVDKLKEELKSNKSSKIWLLSKEINSFGVTGLVRCLGMEPQGDRVRCIVTRSNSGANNNNGYRQVKLDESDLKIVTERDLPINVYDPLLDWGTYHHLPFDLKTEFKGETLRTLTENCYLKCTVLGDLSSLDWVADGNHQATQFDGAAAAETVDVYYAPLNFKDIMQASGRLPIESHPGGYEAAVNSGSLLGLEYSGKDCNGNSVMGMVPCKALAPKIRLADAAFKWPVPSGWTLEQAATVPVVYSTALYALIIRGGLRKGQTVLIHAGSGGVGFAAISICLGFECHVFTTVGTQEKREFLKAHFPSLLDNQIACSRDTTFEEHVLRETEGRGVDLVLNSLAEEKLEASLRCLAPGGVFLEIGKFDAVMDNKLNLSLLDESRSFQAVMLDNLYCYRSGDKLRPNIASDRAKIVELMDQGIKAGYIRPIPSIVFKKDQIEKAFRFMASGKHKGKVVIRMRSEHKGSRRTDSGAILARKNVTFSPKKCYLIVGAFGGLGLEIAFWLGQKGARKLVLNSRRGPVEKYHHYSLQRLKDSGVDVVISQDDLTAPEGADKLMEKVSSFGPLGGVFNCALALNDATIQDQDAETFRKVCAPKIDVTRNLDKITRCPKIASSLDHFVIMSSVVAGRGNPGQANYGFANAAVESICEDRRQNGLPGLAIQWGFIGDVGFVVRNIGTNESSIRGTTAQRIHSCLRTLEIFLSQDRDTVLSTMVRAAKQASIFYEKGDLIKVISHILGIRDIYSCDGNMTLSELGMDSLMAVEIKQALEREYGLSMSPKEIRSLKISRLLELSDDLQNMDHKAGKDSRGDSASDSNTIIQETNEFTLSIQNSISCQSWNEPRIRLNPSADSTGRVIYFFPPIEGNYDQLIPIAKKLSRPVIGLNWTCDLFGADSFQSVASFYAKEMTRKSSPNELNFDVVAYSFGGLVALQTLKALVRKTQAKCRLVLLDSEPALLKQGAEGFLEKYWAQNGVKNAGQAQLDVSPSDLASSVPFLPGVIARNCNNVSLEEVQKSLTEITDREARLKKAREMMQSNGMSNNQIDSALRGSEVFMQKARLVQSWNTLETFDFNILHLKADTQSILNQTNVQTNPRKVENAFPNTSYLTGNHHNFIQNNLETIVSRINHFFM